MRIAVAFCSVLVLMLLQAPGAQNRGGAYVEAPLYDAAFWKIWGDGQAELASYDLTEPHYGKARRGVAITVFVAETFSNSARVKADPGKHPKADEFPVMKLNLIKDFQTGIYDYNDMTSAFLSLAEVNGRKAGSMTKISFSSQEWCGNVYHQLLFDSSGIRSSRHSYFDGEGDQQSTVSYPANGIPGEAAFFWARQMAEPRLAPAETRTLPVLSPLQVVRDSHKAAEWTTAKLSRMKVLQKITVPAGTFDVEAWSIERGGAKLTLFAAKDASHTIVKWESSSGEKAELLAVERMKYWQLNAPGGESNLKRLKLAPRPPKTT